MLKTHIYLLLFIILTPFFAFAQMEEGNIRNDFHIGYTGGSGSESYQEQHFNFSQKAGLWTSNKTLITASYDYFFGNNDFSTSDLAQQKAFQVNLNTRHYLSQSDKYSFFVGANFALIKDKRQFNSFFIPTPYNTDRTFLQLGINMGLNKKISQELYWEGKLNTAYAWDAKNKVNITDVGLTAQIVNFAAFTPKESVKSSEVIRKGTKIIEGTAFINHSNIKEQEYDARIFHLGVRPTYFSFVHRKIAVGGSVELDAILGSNDTAAFKAAIQPTVRYYFSQRQKTAYFAGLSGNLFSSFNGSGDYSLDKLGGSLQIGADYWVGKGLAFESKLSYEMGRVEVNSEQKDIYNSINASISLKYFLTSKK